MEAATLARLLCHDPASVYARPRRKRLCRATEPLCLQPWDLALVLEFPGDTTHPEEFGKSAHITRFVMEVRAVHVWSYVGFVQTLFG